MALIEDAVKTITALLHSGLSEPKRGTWQEGIGGWHYKLVRVGGVKPPYVSGLNLWWLQHKETEYMLYVAPFAGYRSWKWQGAPQPMRWERSCRPKGNLPLLFATGRTPEDSIKAQAGIMLYRQGWQDEAFQEWLHRWVVKRAGEELAGLITIRLLQSYNPATCSPSAYVRAYARKTLLANNPPVESENSVYSVAAKLGMSDVGLYKALRRHGAVQKIPGKMRFRYKYEPIPEVIEAIKQEREAREKHKALVDLVMLKRGVGRRAAQRWVKRRLDKGMSVEDVANELLRGQ